jgi:hypothetical protein
MNDAEWLSSKIKDLANNKRLNFKNEVILEAVDMINKSTLNNELLIETLVELYRFTLLCDEVTSLDFRADVSVKLSIIQNLKEALKADNFTTDSLKPIKSMNRVCLDYRFNPLKRKHISDEFYSKNPGVKF